MAATLAKPGPIDTAIEVAVIPAQAGIQLSGGHYRVNFEVAVIPAQAGIQWLCGYFGWTPACTGVTA